MSARLEGGPGDNVACGDPSHQSREAMQQWLRYELEEDDDDEDVDVDAVKAEELQRRGDDYQDKLAKYVPAETIAFFLGIYYLAESNAWRLLILAVGVVGTLAYLFLAPRSGRTSRTSIS